MVLSNQDRAVTRLVEISREKIRPPDAETNASRPSFQGNSETIYGGSEENSVQPARNRTSRISHNGTRWTKYGECVVITFWPDRSYTRSHNVRAACGWRWTSGSSIAKTGSTPDCSVSASCCKIAA